MRNLLSRLLGHASPSSSAAAPSVADLVAALSGPIGDAAGWMPWGTIEAAWSQAAAAFMPRDEARAGYPAAHIAYVEAAASLSLEMLSALRRAGVVEAPGSDEQSARLRQAWAEVARLHRPG